MRYFHTFLSTMNFEGVIPACPDSFFIPATNYNPILKANSHRDRWWNGSRSGRPDAQNNENQSYFNADYNCNSDENNNNDYSYVL